MSANHLCCLASVRSRQDICELLVCRLISLHIHSANQTSQAYGLVKGILPGVYIVPSEFCRLS